MAPGCHQYRGEPTVNRWHGNFGAPESGVDWSVISAGTLIAIGPLLILFLIFQRRFIQSFMQAGIK